MPLIELETRIDAPIERVFDLARSIDAHMASTKGSSEKAVAGCTSGLIGDGETVTWEATHFGVKQRLSVRVTKFDRPHLFEDEMIRGAFASMSHTRHSNRITAMEP
jgi:ligand-binding SRPBCC domain-containing protein